MSARHSLLGSLVQVDFQGPSQSNILEIPPGYAKAAKSSRLILKIDLLFVTLLLHGRVATHFMYVTTNELRRIIVGKVQLAVEGAKLNPIKEGQEPPKVGRKGKESTKAEAPRNADGSPAATGPRAKAQEIKNHPQALSKSTSKRS